MNNNEFYKYWLENHNIDEQTKQEMFLMSDEDIKNSFKDEPVSFGTAGYRAKMGPGMLYLNEQTYKQLTIAYGKFILRTSHKQVPKIFVAHDNRINGLKYSNLIAAILSDMGIEVYLTKDNLPIPTPMVSYVVRRMKLDGAINITASHNPKEYNGFKVFNNTGSQLNVSDVEILKQYIPRWDQNIRLKPKINKKYIHTLSDSVINDYFNDVVSHLNITKTKENKEPIIFVSHHGTASLLSVINFLSSQGHNIIPVYSQCYINENFENSANINPEDEQSFAEAIKVANKKGAEVIIGLDPDADRLAAVIKHNKKWVYLNGNENGILASYYLLKYKDYGNKVPTIISTYVSNNLINKLVNEIDGLVLRSAVGFKNIASLMNSIENDERVAFVVGFEEAVGLCLSPSIREKDGIAASLLLLEMYKFFKEQNMTLVDVLKKRIYFKYGNWIGKTISFKIQGADWKNKVNDIIENIKHTRLNKIGNFNIRNIQWNPIASCLEIYFDDNQSWIKFRASGTEPKFKIYYNLYFNSPKYAGDCSYKLKLDELNKINDFLVNEFNIN